MLNSLINDVDQRSSVFFPDIARNIFDKISSVIIFCYHIGTARLLYISDSVESVCGYSPQQFFTANRDFLKTIINEQDYPSVLEEYLNLLNNCNCQTRGSNCKSKTLGLKVKTFNEHMIDVELDLILFKDLNQNDQLFGIVKNISDSERHTPLRMGKDQSKGPFFDKRREEYYKLVTPREKEVLQLIANGMSAKKLADELFISVHTAINHRKNLISKLRVKNTAELIKVASTHFKL